MLLALATLACGGDDEATPTPTPTDTSSPTATVEASATPTATPQLAPPVAAASITTNDLNVRSGPDLRWPVVGMLQTGDEVQIAGRDVDGEWLAIPEAGWVFYDTEWMDVDLPLLSLPVLNEAQVIGPMQPTGVTTGIPAIDAFVDLVLASDLDAIEAAAVTFETSCATNPGGAGGPPVCPTGVEDGTSIEVFPVATCEIGHTTTEDLPVNVELAFTGLLGPEELRLYAVFESSESNSDLYPRGTWTLVFADSAGLGRAFFLDGDGNLVQLWLGCNNAAPLMLTDDLDPARWVLRPVTPEALRPAP
ncbi:MAG: SH3 domain-containing protein [Dehalococcoidia bacterium]